MEREGPEAPIQEHRESEQELDAVITEKGSVYRYLPDGTTKRFQTAEQQEHTPQSVLVFVPNAEVLKNLEVLGSGAEQIVGQSEKEYTQKLLGYVHYPDRIMVIINRQGKILKTNQAIAEENGEVYLACGTREKMDFAVPVSKKLLIGYSTFDTTDYQDPKTGDPRTQKHLGNKVVEIRYK